MKLSKDFGQLKQTKREQRWQKQFENVEKKINKQRERLIGHLETFFSVAYGERCKDYDRSCEVCRQYQLLDFIKKVI